MDTIKEFESLYRAGLQMQDCVKRRKDQTKKKNNKKKIYISIFGKKSEAKQSKEDERGIAGLWEKRNVNNTIAEKRNCTCLL